MHAPRPGYLVMGRRPKGAPPEVHAYLLATPGGRPILTLMHARADVIRVGIKLCGLEEYGDRKLFTQQWWVVPDTTVPQPQPPQGERI